MFEKVQNAVLQRLQENDGMAKFKLKANGNIVSVTRRSSGKYFIEVNENTLHRDATLKTVVNLLMGI